MVIKFVTRDIVLLVVSVINKKYYFWMRRFSFFQILSRLLKENPIIHKSFENNLDREMSARIV
jgi:hypothetical protein